MNRRSLLLSICVVSIALANVPAQAQTAPKAYVLDSEALSLTLMDVVTGKPLKTAVLQGQPGALIQVPGGRWVVVLDRGPGKDAGDAGYQAKGKSFATIVDAASLEVGPRVELGWGLDFTPLGTPEGDRLTFVCPGYQSKKPAEVLPRELVTVDLTSGQVTGRLVLTRPASAFFITPDGRTAVILSPGEKPRQAPAIPAELRLVDLAASLVVATLALDGEPKNPVLSPDGKLVYLLEAGKPSGNPEKNVNGRLLVVSIESRKLEATIDVGSKPRGLVLDEAGQRLLLLSNEPPVKGKEAAGELRVIRGPVVQPPIKVAKDPMLVRVAPKVNRLYVLAERHLTTLSLPEFTLVGTMPARSGIATTELTISPDGTRGLMLLGGGYVNVVDLEAGKELDSIRTGRMSALLLNAAVAATLTEVSRRSGERDASRRNQSYYSYTEYTLKDASPSMAMRPDGRFAYVLNNETRDVTIIDMGNATVVDKIGGAGFDIQFMGAGAVAVILSDSVIRRLDTATHKKLEDITVGGFKKDAGFTRLEVSPDGRYAVAHGTPGVLCLDASTGTIVGRPHNFKRVVDVAYVW